MAAIFRQRFKVRGALSFPIDMLRYDDCHPFHESDSHNIAASLRGVTGPHSVTLERLVIDEDMPPSVERWESFDWEIVPTSLTVEEIQI